MSLNIEMKKRLSANSRLEKLQQIYPNLNATTNSSNYSNVKVEQAQSNDSTNLNRCICDRKPQTLLCMQCKMFTYGRIAQICLDHLNVTFLMDFSCCPNCLAPKHQLRGVDEDQQCLNMDLAGVTAVSYGF